MEEASAPSVKRAKLGFRDETVAVYPGEEGSLAHVAATQFFKNFRCIRLQGTSSFAGVLDAVVAGRALYGVIPIENSASGTLHSTYDLLVKNDTVVIGGELGVREIYCLCAKTAVELSAVRRVLSHPNILEACSAFIEKRLPSEPLLATIPTRSTTDATHQVSAAKGEEEVTAAIATREAAASHGLTVIAEDIGNDAFLETRYIVIHLRTGSAAFQSSLFACDAVGSIRKRSACFALRNEPAAAFKLLSCWALRGMDVLKVETRPLVAGHRAPPGLPTGLARLWDYLFYVDYAVPAGHTEQAEARLWEALSEFSLWQRDFGAYPSLITRTEKQPQSWADMVDLMAK